MDLSRPIYKDRKGENNSGYVSCKVIRLVQSAALEARKIITQIFKKGRQSQECPCLSKYSFLVDTDLNFCKKNTLVVQFSNMYQKPYSCASSIRSNLMAGPGLGSWMYGKQEDRVPAPK